MELRSRGRKECTIFRPFHDDPNGKQILVVGNGRGVSPAEFRAAWNYTHWYLTENKGATDLLWAFAPNGGAVYNASADASTYPGDKLVDIVCFDYYGASPTYSDELLDIFSTTVYFALAHNKTPAMARRYAKGTERGKPKWFTEELLQRSSRTTAVARLCSAWAAGHFSCLRIITVSRAVLGASKATPRTRIFKVSRGLPAFDWLGNWESASSAWCCVTHNKVI